MDNQSAETDFIKLRVLDDGNLSVSLADFDKGRDELAEQYDDLGEIGTLSWLFEDLTANGGFAFVDGGAGNPSVGLTSAPCVAEGLSYDDDGQAEVQGRLWWFPQYETVALFEVLLERGEVVFQAAPGNEPTPRRSSKP